MMQALTDGPFPLARVSRSLPCARTVSTQATLRNPGTSPEAKARAEQVLRDGLSGLSPARIGTRRD